MLTESPFQPKCQPAMAGHQGSTPGSPYVRTNYYQAAAIFFASCLCRGKCRGGPTWRHHSWLLISSPSSPSPPDWNVCLPPDECVVGGRMRTTHHLRAPGQRRTRAGPRRGLKPVQGGGAGGEQPQAPCLPTGPRPPQGGADPAWLSSACPLTPHPGARTGESGALSWVCLGRASCLFVGRTG